MTLRECPAGASLQIFLESTSGGLVAELYPAREQIVHRLFTDLGGLHSAQTDQINLDDEADRLGIAIGNDYLLELFHAERHTNESNFRVDTTLEFVDCGIIVPDPPR